MDTNPWLIQLADAAPVDDAQIGGKAAQLARLYRAGFRIAPGFCVKVDAYEQFLLETQLQRVIQMELGRKPFEEMRWEEIWDAALRIRNRFSLAELPAAVVDAVSHAVRALGDGKALAVRSSAPGEDSAQRSFAGLHESILNVSGEEAVLKSVRLVWASLWSDAALLYRQELALDPLRSRMAVLVQEMRIEDRSGVAFGRDPRSDRNDHAVIEAVPGTCSGLVDGSVDPDQWLIHRVSHQIVNYRPGNRESHVDGEPLLQDPDLKSLLTILDQVEIRLGWCPDVEWTGRHDRLTILQARPITRARQDPNDKRAWYMTLRPDGKRLQALCHRVTQELIPELRSIGDQLAAEDLIGMRDFELADSIKARQALVEKWKQIYWDEFIPFAHGVRYLGMYYNDAVHPQDPYEFVGLLKGEDMMASQRNRSLLQLAQYVQEHPSLRQALNQMIQKIGAADTFNWESWQNHLSAIPGGSRFLDSLRKILDQYMDVAFGGERLLDNPTTVLRNILELASQAASAIPLPEDLETVGADELEKRLLSSMDPNRHEEAREVLRLARLSWQLRDDDNLLIARLESQLLRALEIACARLKSTERLNPDAEISVDSAMVVCEALSGQSNKPLILPPAQTEKRSSSLRLSGETPRQLVGQPAAQGLARGRVRVIRSVQDLGGFKAGEVLVCDAIQPMMTHLVPLAAAVVERRGGMLIHGAIIAREMGIPCVNGVVNVVDLVCDGDDITVDGYLGIVTLGEPEFTLELGLTRIDSVTQRGFAEQ